MCEILEFLSDKTYAIEHNPNCPSQYLIRFPGKNGAIDKKPPKETKDIVGYGNTLEEAVSEARRAHVVAQAGWTFDQVMNDPNDPNAKIILAYQP
jgi:hypothetical protein